MLINDCRLTNEVEHDTILQLVLNSLTDQALFTVGPDGFILTWNEGCRRIKRYTADEAIGQHFSFLYTPQDREQGLPYAHLKSALEHGQYHEEGIRLRKGAQPYVAEVSIYPMLKDDKLIGFAKIVRDVSVRKGLETERELSEMRLQKANLELDGFCHSIAHDLRSPIRSIIGRCCMLREDFGGDLAEEAVLHLDVLVKNSKRLAKLIDDLLNFARLGQTDVRRADIDVSAVGRRLAKEIERHCVNGTAHIQVQEGMYANADPSMLELVISNLFENSCKYSKHDPQVWLTMEHLAGEDVYKVRDKGIGFDMRHVAQVFEPFERLHSTDAYEGTGIGLANVRRIVERHGGRIWAESELDKGSTFLFTLR